MFLVVSFHFLQSGTFCLFIWRLQQQHPCFGAACRLAKRWLSAQLFSDDITEDTADLLVASLFLQPAPFTAPRYRALLLFKFFFLLFLCRKHVFLCLLWVMWVNFSIVLSSPQVAFLRFLHLLSSFDWRNNPLIVNLNNELTGKCSLTHTPFPCVWHKQIPLDLFLFTRPTYFYIRPYALLFQRQVFFASLSHVAVDYPEIKNGFMATRESLPVMFIATPKDKKLSMWTKRSPSIQVSGHTSIQITKHLIDQLSALNFKWLNITFV